MQRFFIKLSYFGKNYHGWQVQPNATSVQAVIENALSVLLQEEISVVGCGRTDTGVHAKEFYLHFDTIQHSLDTNHLLYRLNRYLPEDIAMHDIIPVQNQAHARFDAISRRYEYHIHFQKNPFLTDYSLFLPNKPDIEKMNIACEHLYQHTDFTSFSKLHSDNKTNDCKIHVAKWEDLEENAVFTIQADRFLRNMVRSVVGSLLEISDKSMSPDYLREIIQAKNRSNAGKSVPAHGLYLTQVKYPENIYK
jgi:tRNA pseudouridine38-40 synthase